ncbi:MAG: DUF4010 domain-containing protein [Burkholderiales bacterium]
MAFIDSSALGLPNWAFVVGSSVALGGGMLIGLERERRKLDGTHPPTAAGVRSFSLAALGGAWAQGLGEPLLVVAGFLALAGLAGLAFVRQRERDPSVVTAWALCLTYLLGVLSMSQPLVGAAGAVVVAGVLSERERLHRFATGVLSAEELQDALLLGALVLVVLPLLPTEPVGALAGLQPRAVGVLMVLILLTQAVGHIALRLFGDRLGLTLSGFFAGFVSSTATVASMGAQARRDPARAGVFTMGACLSTAATWVLALLMLAVLSPAVAARFAPAALAGAATAVVLAWLMQRGGSSDHQAGLDTPPPAGGVLRLREALWVVCVLTVVTLAVAWARREFGNAGALAGAVLSGFGDAQASVAALATLANSAHMSAQAASAGVLASITANSLTRGVTAFVAGGRAYGLRLASCLLLASASAWAVWHLTGGLVQ